MRNLESFANAKAKPTAKKKTTLQGRQVTPPGSAGFASGTKGFAQAKAAVPARRQRLLWKHVRMVVFVVGLLGSFFVLDSLMLAVVHRLASARRVSADNKPSKVEDANNGSEVIAEKMMYGRLLDLASNAIAQNKVRRDSFALFEEPRKQASKWKPCADGKIPNSQGHAKNRTGFILVSANGGLNQQRVAVCNSVAVAALLNATLVLPRFLYSSVWKDTSQFGDIYQEDYFINYLKDDVEVVKELPSHLQKIDIEAIGNLITDTDIMKEAKPTYFLKDVLPLLLRNGVVHFLGFGNRLAFDPLPSDLQRLRCKCNFHALKFVPRIQEIGSMLVRRIRKYRSQASEIEKHLFGNYNPYNPIKGSNISGEPARYLALHMRFEIDMVAYSLCDFGGGDRERKELQAYREMHFPLLVTQIRSNQFIPSEESKSLGRCPLTPEEAGLILSALGYKKNTYIYLAGSHIYGGQSMMLPFKRLYPNVITKEDILTPSELAPFRNYSSQLAALDFIGCAASDVFAMTDSGSQLASLVTGYRIYHGQGRAPTLRPNKKRFAEILSHNRTIRWTIFEDRVRGMIEEGQRVISRRKGRSVYRLPRTAGCMCRGS